VKLKITVNDKTYEVEVEAVEPETQAASPRGYMVEPASVRVAAAPPAPTPIESDVNEEKVCRSPVSGIVVRVSAQPGQTLQPGDVLLVLEAMKMETNITAPVEGEVRAIRVAQGDPVRVNQVLVEFA
jgi:biotin carboxyl carrier protein